MKKFLSILILMLLAFPAMMRAQSDSTDVASSSVLHKGTMRLSLEHVAIGGLFTKIGNSDSYDLAPFYLFNLGVGVEYAYANDKSVGLDVHSGGGSDGIIGEYGNAHVVFYNVTTSAMHRWYLGKLVLGAGLSYEWRKAKYDPFNQQVGEDEYEFNYMDEYGMNDFTNSHHSLGVDLLAGFTWRNRKWYIGVQYSPRIILKDSFNYVNNEYPPQLPVKNYSGHADHQISLMIRFAFDIANFGR